MLEHMHSSIHLHGECCFWRAPPGYRTGFHGKILLKASKKKVTWMNKPRVDIQLCRLNTGLKMLKTETLTETRNMMSSSSAFSQTICAFCLLTTYAIQYVSSHLWKARVDLCQTLREFVLTWWTFWLSGKMCSVWYSPKSENCNWIPPTSAQRKGYVSMTNTSGVHVFAALRHPFGKSL